MDEVICLDIVDALEAVCRKYKCTHLFQHNMRINNDISVYKNLKKWDQQFFSEKIKKYLGMNAARIWICGPPLVQEYFDRATDEDPEIAKHKDKLHAL